MQMGVLLGMMPDAERHKVRGMIGPATRKGPDMVDLVAGSAADAAPAAVPIEDDLLEDLPIGRELGSHRGQNSERNI